MSVFEQELNDAFNESEKIESTAKEVENRIKSIEGASALLPKRPYGTPVNGASMGLTLKHLINAKDRQLAAYLILLIELLKEWERLKLQDKNKLLA